MKNHQINMAPEPGQAAVRALIAGFASVTIEMEEEDDGRIIAEISALPGCLVYAESREEAVRKVQALALRVIADYKCCAVCGHEYLF